MSWISHSPLKLGHKQFFTKYLGLAEERFERYFPGQWVFTRRLEEFGEKIASKQITDEVSLMLFLIDVAVWKEPYETQAKDMIRHVTDNRYSDIRNAFDLFWIGFAKSQDREAIDAIGSLKGFGTGGSRKIASAVLRFLDSSRFAVVDYRNWMILSNTEGRYFDKPLLEPLASTIEQTRQKPIDTQNYLRYLEVVRELGRENHITPAEVDMALFAFSDEIKPLSGSPNSSGHVSAQPAIRSDNYQTIRHQKMVEVVMSVIIDNRKKGHLRAAQTLESGLKKCKTPGEIMNMCYNMTTKAAYMDTQLAASGTMTLRQIMRELETIYADP